MLFHFYINISDRLNNAGTLLHILLSQVIWNIKLGTVLGLICFYIYKMIFMNLIWWDVLSLTPLSLSIYINYIMLRRRV